MGSCLDLMGACTDHTKGLILFQGRSWLVQEFSTLVDPLVSASVLLGDCSLRDALCLP